MRSFVILLVVAILLSKAESLRLASFRRAAASLVVSSGLSIGLGPAVSLAEGPVKPTFEKGSPKAAAPAKITGTITLGDGVQAPESLSRALYITAKPDLGFINSQLLLRKFPAVMSQRVPGDKVTFPYTYTLNEKEDATEDVNLQREKWVALPMVISVRYDTDGVAATRDETDLVGKGDSSRTPEDSWKQADVVLSDRGVGGKLVTGRK